MEASDILLKGALPGDGHCEEQCVEPCVVEPFTDVASSRDDHARVIFRNRCERLRRRSALLLAHSSLEHENVLGESFNFSREKLEMFLTPRKQERRTSPRQRLSEIGRDHRVARR